MEQTTPETPIGLRYIRTIRRIRSLESRKLNNANSANSAKGSKGIGGVPLPVTANDDFARQGSPEATRESLAALDGKENTGGQPIVLPGC
jgi:hypothetical protein